MARMLIAKEGLLCGEGQGPPYSRVHPFWRVSQGPEWGDRDPSQKPISCGP